MKFGSLNFNKMVNWYWDNSWNNRALLNIGDAAEYRVIEQLLCKFIDIQEIVPLNVRDLVTYRGEALIVPLNIALDSYVGYNSILENLSPDIYPVFLGMSFTETALNKSQLDCLKRFQPIGCRDERSYQLMLENGIECYLNGCMASCIEINNTEIDKPDILFIDVPKDIEKHVPDHIKARAKIIKQELYCKRSDLDNNFVPEAWFESILEQYKKASLIVTSRFHGAVLALAIGVPVIVTLERMTFRFSWLTNFCQIKTIEEFDTIQWNVDSYPFQSVKALMKSIAIERIQEAKSRFYDRIKLTEIMRNKYPTEEAGTNQVLYYEDVQKKIASEWNKNEPIRYAFWGVNDNAVALYDYISREYPRAEYIAVLDMYKEITFMGKKSVHPAVFLNSINDNNTCIIVTAYLASRVANDVIGNSLYKLKALYKCERKILVSFSQT